MFARRKRAPAGRQAAPSSGIGMFTGNPLPQDPSATLIAQLLPSLTGHAGVRLSQSTNRAGRYFGTDLVPPAQALTGLAAVNDPAYLEVAAIKAG